ncbi:hypothetical protein Salat_1154500 [Sesamum alatum]|uniref:Uncharacterized protein n=1 Tax=Sesamum alatum TaxID=300844 RepID=A0AAE1YEG9_9LAMI|nr:hypothetical protein Salat_1154500 [Sesamum alatum]
MVEWLRSFISTLLTWFKSQWMQCPHRSRASTWPHDLGPCRPTLARGAHLCLELGGPHLGSPARGTNSSWGAPGRLTSSRQSSSWALPRSLTRAHQLEAVPRAGAVSPAQGTSSWALPRAHQLEVPRAGLLPRRTWAH